MGRNFGGGLLTLMRRLLSDRAGNTLILTGAMLIPLFALIGSGVDIGRVYIARSRMQQACDASALAGRWAFSQGQNTDQASAEALKYFNFNFKQGSFGTASFTPVVTVTGTSTKMVAVTANTTLPMTLMRVFGFQAQPVSATCTAQQDFVNTDIVLVLDVTGSMKEKASDGDSQTKIQALRSAVLALYDQLAPIQAQLEAAGMRLRYSIVPYSTTVNVGKLIYQVDNDYIWTDAYYEQQCSNDDKNCPTSGYNRVSVSHTKKWIKKNWGGCIEERKTSSSIDANSTAIPSSAYDLDVNLKPVDGDGVTDTRWAIYDPDAEQGVGGAACPYDAKRLQPWTRDDMASYLSNIDGDGSTYHDIGMIWGARMISDDGIFADSPSSYHEMPTNKFMIFMTDGLLNTDPNIYSTYGLEKIDHRVTGGDLNSQNARHQKRFNLMCSRVKNMGVSIWVVAFAQALDSNLKNCATNPGQASTSANSADLITKFTEIGKNIGALRLTK